jgi:pimeloyl-ACP methyl ester carboxylesterase
VVPKIRWVSCGSDFPAFQCATVRVPRDYDKPYGATTTLALTRLPAAKPKAKIGTLFTNPGGPGGSGVDFVQGAAQVLYPQAVRDRFDILGFDPRGVARSDPATCFATAADEEAALATFPAYPLTRAEVRPYLAANKKLARSCAARSPDRFRHLSTANVARDLDLLRRAVGDAKLSYAGYSYGTYLGATYAALFPTKIRALVLDGTLDPREYSGTAQRYAGIPVGNRIEQDRGGAEVFAEFLRQCRLAGSDRCSLAALGDPATVARRTLDQLKTSPRELPLPDGSTVEISYQTAVAAIFSSLYSPAGWADLADLITVLSADPATAERRTAAVSPAVAATLRRTEDYASLGGSLGSTCVDTRTPDPSVYARAADRADARFPDFGRYRTWIDVPCAYLKDAGIRDTDAYRGPWRQSTRADVLVLGTRHDPATPYKNTRPYANLFRHASVVTLEGWGHTTLGQSTCTDARVTAYLLQPNRTRRDATCATDLKPFTAAPTPAVAKRAATAREVVPLQP